MLAVAAHCDEAIARHFQQPGRPSFCPTGLAIRAATNAIRQPHSRRLSETAGAGRHTALSHGSSRGCLHHGHRGRRKRRGYV
jgi:hypothetical protein